MIGFEIVLIMAVGVVVWEVVKMALRDFIDARIAQKEREKNA